MSGLVVAWGQADRNRGAGWSFAHLFWRDAETGLDGGHIAVCGYDPTHHNGVAVETVAFRPAPDNAPRCSRCEGRAASLTPHIFYPLGEHPADLARAAG